MTSDYMTKYLEYLNCNVTLSRCEKWQIKHFEVLRQELFEIIQADFWILEIVSSITNNTESINQLTKSQVEF